MQRKEKNIKRYRILAVISIFIWIAISVIAVVNPSVFRDREGYYQIDDRILYHKDFKWYEYKNYEWLEIPDDIEEKEKIWSHKVPFSDITEKTPEIQKIRIV